MKWIGIAMGVGLICCGLVASASGWTFLDWALGTMGGFVVAIYVLEDE